MAKDAICRKKVLSSERVLGIKYVSPPQTFCIPRRKIPRRHWPTVEPFWQWTHLQDQQKGEVGRKTQEGINRGWSSSVRLQRRDLLWGEVVWRFHPPQHTADEDDYEGKSDSSLLSANFVVYICVVVKVVGNIWSWRFHGSRQSEDRTTVSVRTTVSCCRALDY